MNLLLLPKEIQNLISEYNIDHRPRMRRVMNELLDTHNDRDKNNKHCVNCGCSVNEQYSTFIFWNKYTFCGQYCSYDWESDTRKSYYRSLHN